jgi:GNAT superfamily N-acetyltransferase
MNDASEPRLVPVADAATRAAAEALIREYLGFIQDSARQHYGLEFDVEAMVRSDLDDRAKFYPPGDRFYLLRLGNDYVGVGCLKQLAEGTAEVQRMYVRPAARGIGAGRLVVDRLLADARQMRFGRVRLESLRLLAPAHQLYRSVGFREIDPYADSSMKDYQPGATMDAYRKSAVFMELAL